jgi:hypothetical protein
MRCLRCTGPMGRERNPEPVNAQAPGLSLSWCCIRCGEMMDGVVLPHRIDPWMPRLVVQQREEHSHG